MRIYLSLIATIALFTYQAQAQQVQNKEQQWLPEMTEVWEPEPRVVTFNDHNIPSDAIVLFDGSNASQWQHKDGTPVKWTVADGIMTVKAGAGPIFTKEKYGDMQLHLEWRAPLEVVGDGQGRGNSGVFIQNRYEVQILDSYNNRTYSNGQAGAVYKQSIPLVNATKPTGEWQVYDIIYKAPIYNADGIKTSSASVTVLHNGVVVQNHYVILGAITYIGMPTNNAHGDDVIQLQDHGNPVSYRNIWLRKL